jgi:hypothetical protein
MARPRSKTNVGAQPPTTEIGSAGLQTAGVGAWSSFVDTREYVPELTWPTSCQAGGTYDQMRTDSQLAALFFGVTMPIRRYKWMIDPNGAEQGIVDALSYDLGLDVKDQEPKPRGRTKNRFSHDAHLRKALLALIYGHMYFEQVGYIGDSMNLPSDGQWHLRKLAERLPSTLQQINVAADGGLVSIKQVGAGSQAPEIPVDHLVGYVWDGEGGNWAGRSLFRDVYKNWLIKDRLLRVDAWLHERAGGIPIPIAPDDADAGEMEALAEFAAALRVGEESGGSLPPGTKWTMAKGSQSGVIESIRYHDESMARRFLMMIAMLAQGGTTLGSYSLGEVFSDFFSLGQEAIANWYMHTTNEHVIEDYVDWNWGPEVEQVPLIMYDSEYDTNLPTKDLVDLINSKALLVDDELEDWLRDRKHLPKRGTPREPAVPAADPNAIGPGAPNTQQDQPEPTSTTKASARLDDDGRDGSGAAPSHPSLPIGDRTVLDRVAGVSKSLVRRTAAR